MMLSFMLMSSNLVAQVGLAKALAMRKGLADSEGT